MNVSLYPEQLVLSLLHSFSWVYKVRKTCRRDSDKFSGGVRVLPMEIKSKLCLPRESSHWAATSNTLFSKSLLRPSSSSGASFNGPRSP